MSGSANFNVDNRTAAEVLFARVHRETHAVGRWRTCLAKPSLGLGVWGAYNGRRMLRAQRRLLAAASGERDGRKRDRQGEAQS